MKNILLIEDSIEAQILITKALSDFKVESTRFYSEALKLLEKKYYDLILLDINLPDGNGYDICKKLKNGTELPRVPIIMITGDSKVEDRVKGLSSGADDYVSKPFSTLELKARVESVLRRGPTRNDQNQVNYHNLLLKIAEQKAFISTLSELQSIDLTPVEFKILLKLVQTNSTIARKDLMQFVWGEDIHISPRNVDTHVCKLRKKIEKSNLSIKNKRGHGYFIYEIGQPTKQPIASNGLPCNL